MNKTNRTVKEKYRAIDFIIEDMRLMQNFEEFVRKSGKIEITYTPGCFHITSKIRSSSHGDLKECMKALTLDTK